MNNRVWIKILSILLGVFAWIYVNLVIPPQIRRTLPAEVEYRNIPEMVTISPAKPTVQVQMEGTRRDFILSSSGRVQVSVDLYNVRPGRAQLPVRVIAAPGLTVVSVSPPQVQIEVIPLALKKFDVRIETLGMPADGYLSDKPRLTPDQVTLEGPESLINRVNGCVVEVNLEQIKNSISEQRAVKVQLEGGLSSEEITITPATINLDILVKEGEPSRPIALGQPEFINRLPEGKKLDSFRLIPETLTVKGPTRALKALKDIAVKQIDLAALTSNATIPLQLDLPAQFKVISTETPVLAINLVDEELTRTFHGLTFELKKTSNQHASVSVSSYSLEMKGFLQDLEKVSDAQLKIVLDIEKMKPGSYENIELGAPPGLPASVSVTIKPVTVDIQVSELPDEPVNIASGEQQIDDLPNASSTVLPASNTVEPDKQ
jgi:YbbR domain-containing protein